MASTTKSGFLVLGDITGYTSYVAETELQHSQEILTEILELIVEKFRKHLNIVKLEGDAVFAHIPDGDKRQEVSVYELVKETYFDFKNRIESIVRHTTCDCKACETLPRLNLKFFVHYGQYVIQNVSGIQDLLGSDVNLLHKLTKNKIRELMGLDAYILLTENCLKHLKLNADEFQEHYENYEHIGPINLFCLGLESWYESYKSKYRRFIEKNNADYYFEKEFNYPREVVWEWVTEPKKRNLLSPKTVWSTVIPFETEYSGKTNHCAHGNGKISVEMILDWRPYNYFTARINISQKKISRVDHEKTIEFIKMDYGTKVKVYTRIIKKNPLFTNKIISRIIGVGLKRNFSAIEKKLSSFREVSLI